MSRQRGGWTSEGPRYRRTSIKPWVLLAPTIASEVVASLALKGALARPALYVVVVVGYLAAFVLLGAVLKAGMPLGVAYAFWGAIGVVAVAVMSSVAFDETLTTGILIGIALVVSGVVVVEIGRHREIEHGDGT